MRKRESLRRHRQQWVKLADAIYCAINEDGLRCVLRVPVSLDEPKCVMFHNSFIVFWLKKAGFAMEAATGSAEPLSIFQCDSQFNAILRHIYRQASIQLQPLCLADLQV